MTRDDVLAGELATATAGDADVVTVAAGDSLLVALEKMVDEHADHLPVVVEGRLVGVCTRTDLLHARGRHLGRDRLQHGWMRRRNGQGAESTTPVV